MAEKAKAPPYIPRLRNSLVEVWVKDALSRYAVLYGIDRYMHFSGQLVAIMHRLSYVPKRELLAGNHRIDPDVTVEEIGHVGIVQKHVSSAMLNDMTVEIELKEADSTVEVLAMRDSNGQLVEGTVFVGESGAMSYVDHKEEPLDTSKDRGPEWGTW